VAVGTDRILLLEHYGHKRRFRDKSLANLAFGLAMALQALPNRALQVSQGLSAHGHADVSLHEDESISRNMYWQISLFNKIKKRLSEAHKITRSREIKLQDGRYAVQAGRAVQQAADLEHRHGGTMRIRRALIIPAIFALGLAGSALSGSAMAVAAGHAPSVQVQVAGASGHPHTYYHL
jgi:hypothetical protein